MTDRPNKYSPHQIEADWQAKWAADGLYQSRVDPTRPKHYALTMLPYPSGNLHIGHWFAMTPSDARARFKRMNGYNVLFPMGFDAFGLPAENAAIKNHLHPAKWTYANIDRMRLIGRVKRSALTRNIIAGRSGSFCNSSKTGWPIVSAQASIFARTAIPPWRVNRCGVTIGTANAAERR